jgi:hypothetical protein
MFSLQQFWMGRLAFILKKEEQIDQAYQMRIHAARGRKYCSEESNVLT